MFKAGNLNLPIIGGYHDVLGHAHKKLNELLDKVVIEMVKQHVNDPHDPEKALEELERKGMGLVCFNSRDKPLEHVLMLYDKDKPIDGYMVYATADSGTSGNTEVTVKSEQITGTVLDTYYELRDKGR